jgi:hypothetical protein
MVLSACPVMSRTTACICDDIFLLERRLEQRQQSLDQLVPLTVLMVRMRMLRRMGRRSDTLSNPLRFARSVWIVIVVVGIVSSTALLLTLFVMITTTHTVLNSYVAPCTALIYYGREIGLLNSL